MQETNFITRTCSAFKLTFEKLRAYNSFYEFNVSNEKIEELQKHYEKLQSYRKEVLKNETININYVTDLELNDHHLIIHVGSSPYSLIMVKNGKETPSVNSRDYTLLKNSYYCFEGGDGEYWWKFPLKELPTNPTIMYNFIRILSGENNFRGYRCGSPVPHNKNKTNDPYSVEELKNFIQDPYFIRNLLKSGVTKEAVETLGWLLDQPKPTQDFLASLNRPREELRDLHNYLFEIVSVFELPKNYRLIITRKAHGPNKKFFQFSIVGLEEAEHAYCDVGRLIAFLQDTRDYGDYVSSYGRNLNPEIGHRGIYLIDDDPLVPPGPEALREYYGNRRDVERFLRNDNIKRLLSKFVANKTHTDKKEEQEKVKLSKILTRIADLNKNPDLTLILNEVRYSKDKFEYAGQIFSASNLKMSEFLKTSSVSIDFEDMAFDVMFDRFIHHLTMYIADNQDKKITGTIGNINFTLLRNKRSYINDIRINNEEVFNVLQRALCFNNTEDFNQFLRQVSKCSLRIHTYLAKGITTKIYDNLLNTTLLAQFPLLRKNGKHFLVLNETAYSIHDLNKLLVIDKSTSTDKLLEVFSDNTIIEIPQEIFATIVKEAKDAYLKAIEKSHQLLKEVEEKFNLKLTQVSLNGKLLTGYIIEGHLRKYFIEAKETNDHTKYQVYDYPEGRHRCIVDKHGSVEEVGVDKLVNRIFALKNDKYVAQQITTLN